MANDVRLSSFFGRVFYDDGYKNNVFYTWYVLGKPRAVKLRKYLEPSMDGSVPSMYTLNAWIDEFKPKAEELDREVDQKIKDLAVQEKIEMLERHAELGQKMQETALKYLEENADKLNPNSAVRLLVDGVRIERESRGLPSLITEINKSSDDEIIEQINKLLSGSEIIDVESEYDESLSDL